MSGNHNVTELELLRAKVAALEQRLSRYENGGAIPDAVMSHAKGRYSGPAVASWSAPGEGGGIEYEEAEQALRSAELERLRAEQALRESEARYARATAAAKVGVWEVDVSRGLYHGDPNLKALFGYQPDELGTDPLDWLHLVHPDDQGMAAEQWFRVAAGQSETYHCELRMLHKTGAIIWTEVRGQALRDEHGAVQSILGSTLDITERRAAELALREQEEKLKKSERELRLVLNALPIGVCLINSEGEVILSNPAAQRIWCGTTDVQAEDDEGKPEWKDLIHRFPPHRSAMDRVLKIGAAALDLTLNIECLDGTPKKIRYSAVPVRGKTGDIMGAIVVIEDRTERMFLEEQAHLFRTLMDHSSDAVFMCDPRTGRFLDVNASACRHLGYTREELLQLKASDIEVTVAGGTSWSNHTVASPHSGSRTVTGRHRRKDGETMPVEVNVGFVSIGRGDFIVAVARDISDRERAEKQLRRSEHRFRTLIQCSSDIITILNPDATIRYKSPAFYRLFGYREEEVLGQNVFTFFHPDDVQRVKQIFQERLPTPGLTEPIVFGFRKADGGYLKLESVGNNLLHDPAVRGIVVTCREVTGRIRAEEALRASEARLRALADHAPVSIFMSDPEGHCVYVNQRWCDMTGYSPSEAYGRGWLRTLPPDEPDPFPKTATDVAAIPALEQETQFLTKSGTIRWAETSIVPLHNAQQELTGYIWTSTDITERRRFQNELLKSHAFIRHIIDTDPNLIFAKDRDGRYTLVNKAVADFYGTRVEALIGKTDAEVNHNAEEVAALRRQDLEVMQRGTELYIPEETVTDAAGTRHWFQTVKRPLMNEQGIASHVLGAATDITARKKMEEALLQREQALQTALAERERISEELHDGLLQSLYGVGLGMETCKSLMKRDSIRAVQTLERAVSQLNAVMREVRNFIAGLESELLQGGDLSRALQTVVESLAGPQGLIFRVMIDKQATRQISREQSLHVLNVVREAVSNSLRHSKASLGMVTVRRLKRVIRVTVRDNGIGFSPKAATGVGHGLMNMSARAKRVGGRLRIESRPKQGTRIVFDLPTDIQHGRA